MSGYHCQDCDWRSDPAAKVKPGDQRFDHEDRTAEAGARHRTATGYTFENYLSDRAFRDRERARGSTYPAEPEVR